MSQQIRSKVALCTGWRKTSFRGTEVNYWRQQAIHKLNNRLLQHTRSMAGLQFRIIGGREPNRHLRTSTSINQTMCSLCQILTEETQSLKPRGVAHSAANSTNNRTELWRRGVLELIMLHSSSSVCHGLNISTICRSLTGFEAPELTPTWPEPTWTKCRESNASSTFCKISTVTPTWWTLVLAALRSSFYPLMP